MSDYLQEMVDRAVTAAQVGPSMEAFESLAPLAELDPSTLLPELFLQVEEESNGVDMDHLRPTELVPDAEFARSVVDAVVSHNMELLRSTVAGDYAELVVALISVIAALKDTAKAG